MLNWLISITCFIGCIYSLVGYFSTAANGPYANGLRVAYFVIGTLCLVGSWFPFFRRLINDRQAESSFDARGVDKATQRNVWYLLGLGIPSAFLSAFVNHLWDSNVGYLLVVTVIAVFLLRDRRLGTRMEKTVETKTLKAPALGSGG